MTEGRRIRLSAEQRTEIWRRWKAGESLREIGRAFGKDHGSIQFLLSQRGGIVPAVRRRSLRTLTLAEREGISRGIASGSSIREIARGLERAASTVSREVVRHGGRSLYRASEADHQAWKSALRPRPCLLALHRKLRTMVASKLILDWSPEQISGWLKKRYPNNESMRVSHETIYRSLFIQARGVLKKELMQHLRSQRLIRRSRHARLTDSPMVRSSMPSPSGKDLQKWKTALFPVIGKVICSQAPATVTSQPWWNDIRVLSS
jgi:IS30 family transposase